LPIFPRPRRFSRKTVTVVGLRCIRMELGEPDSSGRRRPIPVPGTEYDMDVDQVIPAIGQTPDLSALEDIAGLSFSRWGTVDADTVTYATGRDGVFAGGDLHTGPWIAIGAIAAGREAAESIVRYLDGRDMAEGRKPVSNEHPVYRPIPEDEPRKERGKMPALPLKERQGNFKEVELGYDEATGREEAGRCLNCGYCCECYQCVAACGPHAVTLETHREEMRKLELEVGSVILAPGFVPFDPSRYETYNYVNYPNIVTSLEFERILSASGPTMGHLVRPSDGKEPRKIAWLQCVGSRDINRATTATALRCAACTPSRKRSFQRSMPKRNSIVPIFFMDMRTHGKDFERYYDSAREKHGVRFIRSRVHTIDPLSDTGDLVLKYVNENGELLEETFDMVVLSVGMETSKETLELAETLGLTLTKGQFCATHPFSPVSTSREGIYVCGVFQGPRISPVRDRSERRSLCGGDGPERARWTQTKSKDIPEELDVSSQEPRIGVFVCNCGTNIGGIVDVPSVEHYASTLPHVVHVEQNLFTCAQDTQDRMKA
jgi:thioredoxin reductase